MALPDNLYVYDMEVFAHDWLFIAKEVATGARTIIHNDAETLIEFFQADPLMCGFNNKHYDDFMVKAIWFGAVPEQVKAINDEIIVEGIPGWDIDFLKNVEVWFNFDSFDLMDDMQVGFSLKSIEAHLGIPIEETEVDFDIDHALTPEEYEQTVKYCSYDVDATEKLLHLRESYLQTKITLGSKRGINPRAALRMTNAKLTSVYLQAKKHAGQWDDERNYQYPDKLLRQYIPQEVFDFFDRLHDPAVPDYLLFGGYDEHGTKHTGAALDFKIGDCECTIAYGGIHGAIPTYTEEATETRSIRNKDVASYYPHLMTIPLSAGKQFGFASRCMPSPKVFADTLEERVKAKRAGDKATANSLKLVLNTTYGCMLNGKDGRGYNDLYDPLMGRSVCITGQLLLLELSMHLVAECPTLKIVQLNTDGIMVSFDNSDETKWEEITQEWQDRTGFELEEDFIKKIVQRDVNNYIEIPADDGEPKIKGGELVRGMAAAGAWKINNNMNVVSRAIVEYYVHGVPAEKTINAATDILDFQMISKASGLYSRCFQIVDGQEVNVQRVNRVYATGQWEKYGCLYKTHKVTGVTSKIPSLPKHCIVDNNNHLTLQDIDKQWYIDLANRKIEAFQGIKPPRVNTRKINSLAKQALALFDKVPPENKKGTNDNGQEKSDRRSTRRRKADCCS